MLRMVPKSKHVICAICGWAIMVGQAGRCEASSQYPAFGHLPTSHYCGKYLHNLLTQLDEWIHYEQRTYNQASLCIYQLFSDDHFLFCVSFVIKSDYGLTQNSSRVSVQIQVRNTEFLLEKKASVIPIRSRSNQFVNVSLSALRTVAETKTRG